MSAIPPIIATDRECLAAFSRRRDAESLRSVIERYLAFVYSSALRRTGDASRAEEVTRAVFIVFARRARRLRKRTVLAGWLFRITALACKKLGLKRARRWRWLGPGHGDQLPADAPLWARIAPEIDCALDPLASKQRDAVLLCCFLNHSTGSAAQILGTREHRVQKRLNAALKKLTRRLRKRASEMDPRLLAFACAGEGSSMLVPEGVVFEILNSVAASISKRPSLKLARRTLNTLAWRRWRRRFVIGAPCFILLLGTTAGAAWYIDSLSGHSRLISAFLVWSVKNEAGRVPGLAQPVRPWPTNAGAPELAAASVRSANDLYQTTNIWWAHLKFSREQWKALEPKRIGALPNFLQPDGTALLRNPKAQRSGLAGVLGFDFNWTHADLEFGGVRFTNVAARIKGNGTYLSSLSGSKRAFKVDLNRFTKGQKLAGLDELTFNNLINDHSFMSDTLAYEFFRDAGVPAPRTAYAWLTVTVEKEFARQPRGLYVMVEAVDEEFAAERFSKKSAVLKPVTYQLFEDLGDDWTAYAAIYDPKTKVTVEQQRRVIEFAQLVSHASGAEFAQRLGEYLDLDEFARFLAGEVLLSSYDGLLSDGQNFYVYLDSRSNKFGFVPWDLDLAWGSFFLLGTVRQREQASIWHPWVGKNLFLERVMAVEEFQKIYRAHLEDFSTRLFVPSRLNQRIDQLAEVIRSPIAAESDFRLDKFEQAIGTRPVKPSRGSPQGPDRPAHRLKRFIEKRAISVREQLDGKSEGVILKHNGRK